MTALQNTGGASSVPRPRPIQGHAPATHRMRRLDYFPTRYRGALWMAVCRSSLQPPNWSSWPILGKSNGPAGDARDRGGADMACPGA
jgi:hypothetical protein